MEEAPEQGGGAGKMRCSPSMPIRAKRSFGANNAVPTRRKSREKKAKNIQQQVFASGHWRILAVVCILLIFFVEIWDLVGIVCVVNGLIFFDTLRFV